MDFSILQQLGVAIALGTLIGLEREHRHQLRNSVSFGGIRTFALISLMGALGYILSGYSEALFVVITGGFLGLVIAAYFVMTYRYSKHRGATSEVAAVLVYMIGVLSAMQQYLIATVVALAVLTILHFKHPLHKWAKKINSKELVSTIQFIIITFVILPLLPNQGYGPYEFFNPYVIWLMVVFVSGISFASYVAMKLFGTKRGIYLTGFLAGFISTTALSFSFAAMSRKNKNVVYPYVVGLVIAVSALFFRVLLEVAVVNPEMLAMVAIPLVTMGILGIALSIFLVFRRKEKSLDFDKKAVQMESPFQLKPAIHFAVLFAVILFVAKFFVNAIGDSALYFVSLVGGLVDMDSITISMARLARTDVSGVVATIAITIAVITNTLTKAGIFLLFGSKKVALRILAVFLPIMLIGGLSLIFI